MKISKLRIENFRSIKSLSLSLNNTTVFIGPNNAGKSAIIEAVRIALSRRWGQRGTGFTENDVHLLDESADPRTSPPVKIAFEFEEQNSGEWPADMVANLEDITNISSSGLNKIVFSITYTWNQDKEIFEPAWEFLNAVGEPLPPRRRSINLSGFYDYVLFSWLGALRDADEEFAAKSRNWGGLLRTIKVPPELEKSVKETLDNLDAEILNSDPKLSRIAETIGRATEIAIEERPGAARMRMLPLNIWDMLSRAGIVLRNEDSRPWLPLGHHGQGLQSLSIIFLFQAAASQLLLEGTHEGAEPIFAIEEPEAHLHPQAARTLWERISEMPGQKLVTTHSPYFVQNVPLHNLHVVRFRNGTETNSLPRKITSKLPWSSKIQDLINGKKYIFLSKSSDGYLETALNFDESVRKDLANCWCDEDNADELDVYSNEFRHASRVLISEADETELSFLGRRIRGEIFFARKWIMVEGVSEYLLLMALGKVFDFNFDQYGISIIDFQNNGNASIYPALAEAFGIQWYMVSDGDGESERFKNQLLKRGFNEKDLEIHFDTLPSPNNLEEQLLVDGNEKILREILFEIGDGCAKTCSIDDLKNKLKNRKTAYMSRLAPMVASDLELAKKMPQKFINLVEKLKANCQL